jgi:ABC-2 type transport system ATP-binding protein
MTGSAPNPAATLDHAGSEQVLVAARELTKRYGDFTAVDRLSFEVRRGEIYGLLGPNGAGKTTTILMLLGLTEPTAGEARVLGLDPARHALAVKRRVGYLPDAVGFYDRLTARENLRYTARLNRIDPDATAPLIARLLEQVGLGGVADEKRVGTFSRGMLQRLGIADALLKEPDLLILDEPTMAIDPAGVVELLDLIAGLSRERGIAVLLASHLLAQVEGVCDRAGIFRGGRLIAEGSVRELALRAGGRGLSLDEAYRRLVRGETDGDSGEDAGGRPH